MQKSLSECLFERDLHIRWAWLPLYQATGNTAYLDAAKTLAEATEKLIQDNELLPQDYFNRLASMGYPDHRRVRMEPRETIGVVSCHKDPRYKETTRDYIDSHMRKFQRDDGLWNRSWERRRAPLRQCT